MKPWIEGSGGGGGAAQVFSDGTTIQGNGLSSNKLAVIPITSFSIGGVGQQVNVTSNKVQLWGFYLPAPITFSDITVNISNADGGNLYDIGIYDSSGNLLAHIGAQGLPNIGDQTFAVVGAPITIPQGKHIFAWTGNSGGAQFNTATGYYNWISNGSAVSSSGGVLPATITIPSITFDRTTPLFGLT